ncbi:MAG: beta-galactosidase, partial [Lentisphaeria bacterium]|nr:beta-galactosidase [Lentisphaeria bacterium]
MKRTISMIFVLAAALPLLAKHDSSYLNKVTNKYVTPHYEFQQKPDAERIRPLFILMRSGARDAMEVDERMPMDPEHFLVYGRFQFAHEDMYESTHEGTSNYEKEKEISDKLEKEYDIYIVGQFEFTKLPQTAQFQILNAVRNGKSLIFVQSGKVSRLPYKALYRNEIDVPKELKGFANGANRAILQAYQVGKGKFITLSWNAVPNIVGRSILPVIPYGNQWKTQHENSCAFFAMLCRYAAGRDLTVKNPKIRIRDAWNKDVTEVAKLPGGTYYKDLIGENGSFRVEEFKIASPVGKVAITLPETADRKKTVSGSAEIEIPSKEDMTVTVELYDSPYGRIWFRKDITLPAGAKKTGFSLENYYMPALAGYVRLTFKGKDGKAAAIADRLMFFPDRSLEDYWQIGWEGISGAYGELLAPQMNERLGWNLMLSHPTANGANARDAALLNMKFVPYMVRVNLKKSKTNGVEGQWAFFLPAKSKKDLESVKGDECFYRPEVQKLWSEGIAHRIKNLPKYSTAIYNLGDENGFSYEAGFGDSDLVYFRKFLKEKYGTIANLNYNYGTEYADFDEIPHLSLAEAKSSGCFPAWGDHRAYMEKMYADIHAFLREEIRKYDPGAPVGAEGSVPGDLELTMGPLEFWGPYSNLVGDELLRSFGNEKIRSLWWGGYPGSHGGRGKYVIPLNRDLLLGSVNGNAWFSCRPGSNHGAFGVDFSIAPYVKNYLADLDRLKDGSAQLMIRNPMENTGVSFYWSHPSSAAAFLDKRCVNPHEGLPSLIRAAYHTGTGFEFVSGRTLDRLKKTKVLFLCGTSALSETECKAILDYVKNGGVVIADFNPAIMNDNLRINETNPLKALFGDITFVNAEEPKFKPLELANFKAARVPRGKSVFTERKYGKGKAILCNFSLASASNTAQPAGSFDGWILSLLKKYGAAPSFDVGKVEETTYVRSRHNRDFSLLGIMQQPQHMEKPVDINLNGMYHVYETDGKYLGQKEKLHVEFKNSPLVLFS